MNSKNRKNLIEKVALRWKEGGIKELETFGNFKKYTPLFHFEVGEPYAFGKNSNFIFITELFGNIEQTPEDAGVMYFKGMRRQLQGNYEGLQNIVLQGFTESHITPYKTFKEGIGEYWTVNSTPAQALGKIEEKDKKLFDEYLLYFENVTKWALPKTFHLPIENKETFEDSHIFP